MLGVMRASILTLSFKRITRSLAHYPGQETPPVLDPEQLTIAGAIGKAVERAAAHTLWESACLVQALTAQKMLKKRGIPGVFYLGAAKAKEGEDKMQAHAWLQCDSIILTGAEGHEQYTVLSSIVWDS